MSDVTANPFVLIGLSGGAGIGKSTIAREFWLREKLQILSYAHPLKAALLKMTGLDRKWFYDIDYKEREIPGLPGVTPRIMMQKFGTEFARDMIAPDFWLWRMSQSFSKYSDKSIVVDDVRFENEAQHIRENGGVIIHLRREFESPTVHNEHKSEQPITVHDLDFIVDSTDNTELQTYEACVLLVKEYYYGF